MTRVAQSVSAPWSGKPHPPSFIGQPTLNDPYDQMPNGARVKADMFGLVTHAYLESWIATRVSQRIMERLKNV